MLKLLCCCGSAVRDNFKDVELANEKALVVVTTDPSSRNGAPTNAEYYKAAGIGFLDTLNAVSKFAPKPVPEIVQLGVALIKAFDSAEATLESAKALRSRIEVLIAILIDEVPKNENIEKGEAEIPPRLLKDVLKFQNDLNSTITKLNAIEKQRQPLLLVFQGLNEQKVQECATCLAASLTQFELSAQIGNIRTIEELKKRIIDFQTSLEEINSNMKEVKTKVTDVQETLQDIRRKLDANQRRQTLLQRPDLPPLPHVFYGKDSVVAEAAEVLTQTERKHLALIGQGGIGKTTTALAVLHDARIQRHFTTTTTGDIIVSDRRIWVSCIGVDTVEGFELALRTAVAGWQESPNARQTVMNKLKSLDGPILVILDNFETPWDAPSVGTIVRSILESFDALPLLHIFVTMRAGEAPCHDLDWHVMNANAVDDEAAKSIYSKRRHGSSQLSAQEDGASLAELLKMVGNHPLAINLLAASARKKKATTSDLLSQYKSFGTSMLGPSGGNQYNNMDRCVQVSIDRLAGTFREASIHLLARLSMLPVGTTLTSFWLEDLKDTLVPALDLLIDAALVQTEQSESGPLRYAIHPVIRDYILAEPRRPTDVLVRLLERAHAFLETYKYEIGEVGFKDRAAVIRAEEANLQAVLLVPSMEDVDNGLKVDAHLNALLYLAKHYAATSPRLEVADKAVSLAKSAHKPLLQAEALFTMGKNLHGLDRYPEAKKSFESARELFRGEAGGGQAAVRAADCLLEVVFELQYMLTESFYQMTNIIDEALAEYRLIPDEVGIGRCFSERGHVFFQHTMYKATALDVLQEACKLLVNSPYDLGLCHFFQMRLNFSLGNFEEGDRCGKLAIELLRKLGSTADLARTLHAMGLGYNQCGHYQSAVEILNEAIDKYTECGLLLGLAQAWHEMSLSLIEIGKTDLAAKSIEEAHKFSLQLPEGNSKKICLMEYQNLRGRLEAKGKIASIEIPDGDL